MRSPVSYFSQVKSDINIPRSSFQRNSDHKTTMSAGLLYPIFWDEVLPGDTHSLDVASLVRMSTPIHPVMDDCFLDLFYFFVPARLTWEHWKQFMGEPEQDPYLNDSQYSVPQLHIPYGELEIPPKSILDYMGVCPGTSVPSISALPFRAFCLIWNEWFRDQNLMRAIDVPLDDADLEMSGIELNPSDETSGVRWFGYNNRYGADAYVSNAAHGGDLPPVAKYHDYFTSALKSPQKGDPVAIPLNGFAPVYAADLLGLSNLPNALGATQAPIKVGVDINGSATNQSLLMGVDGSGTMKRAQIASSSIANNNLYFNNLVTDLGRAQAASDALSTAYSTISDLRYAFQMQKFLEADNRGGTRYREVIYNHFKTVAPDTEIQVPEFLGGKRIHINMNQVLQTSSTDETSPQGNTAAYSLTSDSSSAFSKSFTEHGYIFCVACIRTSHTYSQGISKSLLRKDRFDYYFPEFANISEQPIYNSEIYSPPASSEEAASYPYEGIFGFQSAWADYRYKPNRLSGEFRPTYAQSLDSWHYGDYYTSQPYLSSEWIRETRANIDRTLAVSSDVADQFICDFYFKLNSTRVMPVTSIPGLADHH